MDWRFFTVDGTDLHYDNASDSFLNRLRKKKRLSWLQEKTKFDAHSVMPVIRRWADFLIDRKPVSMKLPVRSRCLNIHATRNTRAETTTQQATAYYCSAIDVQSPVLEGAVMQPTEPRGFPLGPCTFVSIVCPQEHLSSTP